MPSKVSEIVKVWREDLRKVSVKAAESLADPEEYPNLFPELEFALKAEKYLGFSRGTQNASEYQNDLVQRQRDFIQEIREGTLNVDDLPESPVESDQVEITENELVESSPEDNVVTPEDNTETNETVEVVDDNKEDDIGEEDVDVDSDLDLDVDDIISDLDAKDVDLDDIDIDLI